MKYHFFPNRHVVGMIHHEHFDRCSTFRGHPHDACYLSPEMFSPPLDARMEQWRHPPAFGIDACQIWPLV